MTITGGTANFYDAETFTLRYSLPSNSGEYYTLLPDVNGNGEPDVLSYYSVSSRYTVRIRDLKTGTVIKAWGGDGNSYLAQLIRTIDDSCLKLVFYVYNSSSASASTIVYSLGVNAPTSDIKDLGKDPTSFLLQQNYPNPFNPSTTISYEMSIAGDVALSIYDVSGRLVRKITQSNQRPGSHLYVWNGEDDFGKRMPSGAYFYQIVAGEQTQTKKAILLK